MRTPRLFITGASGYVGRRLLERIDRDSFSGVVALVRDREPGLVQLAGHRNVALVVGDLLKPATYREALEPGDRVLHLAATTGKVPPATHFRVNLDGTEALLATCAERGVGTIVHVSSIAAKFKDQRRYFYAESKKLAERLVTRSELPFTIVRPTMVLGPGAPVLEALSRLARLPVMPVFGDGHVRVQPIFVDDLADTILEILTEEDSAMDGQTIEIGGPEVIGLAKLLTEIRVRRLGKTGPRIHVPVAPLRLALTMIETMSLDLVPMTAGQLATFVNDGTAVDSAFLQARIEGMSGLDDMLAPGPSA